MSIYAGVRCPVCEKKFTSADDVVVCPVCGAPHHRDCYKQLGQCAFEEEHDSGREWSAPRDEGGEASHPHTHGDSTRICSRCNAANPAGGVFCNVCGYRLEQEGQPSGGYRPPSPHLSPVPHRREGGQKGGEQAGFDPWNEYDAEYDASFFLYGGLSPDEVIEEEATARELAAHIGPSSGYYLPRFKRMSGGGLPVSMNFSALIFNFFYYFYRKMYLIGAILLAVYLLRMVPVFLYFKETFPLWVERYPVWKETLAAAGLSVLPQVDLARAGYYETLNTFAGYVSLAIGFLTSLCANRFYFDHSMRSLKRIRREFSGGDAGGDSLYLAKLSRSGGCNRIAVVLAAVGVYTVASVVAFFILYWRVVS